MAPLRSTRSAAFVGWRYLFRRRYSRPVLCATIALGALAAALTTTFIRSEFSDGSWTPGLLASGSVLTLLLFTSILFLNFFSVFTTISMTGVFWGVAALTVVLAVTSGFQEEFQSKVLGVNAHIIVMKYGLDFSEYRDVAAKAEAVPHVLKPVAPFVFNEMMVAHGTALSGVLVKGIVPDKAVHVLDIAERMIEGSIHSIADTVRVTGGPPVPGMVVGKELAKKLHARVGDSVRLIAPLANIAGFATPENSRTPRMREFRITGIFYSGFDEYDRRLAYIHLPEAQLFLGEADTVTGVEMKLDDVYTAPSVARDLDRALGGPPYRTIDWRDLNRNLFTALRMQKLTLGLLLFLIILVAMFGVIATLTMLVVDKTREIAIVKSMGMRASGIAATFQIAGMTIGALGTFAGIALGLAVCGILERYSYHLDPRVYLIDRLPVRISVGELAAIAVATLVICFLATLIPSVRAARLRPVEGLRYE